MEKQVYSVRLGPEAVEALGELGLKAGTASGRAAEALEGLVRLAEEVRQAARAGFAELNRRFAALVGAPPRPVDPPAPVVLAESGGRGLGLDRLVRLGVWAELEAAGAAEPPEFPWGPGLVGLWGEALGRALGFDGLLSAALGEFCRSWVYGISCRYGNLDSLVAELEFAFAGGLTGKVGDGAVMWAPAERRLFPAGDGPAEAEAYRRAWRAVLGVLAGVRDGRFRVGADGIRLRDAGGVPAALAVLREEAAAG